MSEMKTVNVQSGTGHFGAGCFGAVTFRLHTVKTTVAGCTLQTF
jgi:hypothetical protein